MEREVHVSAIAMGLVARGLSCLPLGSNKRPTRAWKQWQERLPKISEVGEWSEATSLALITGSISGIVVVDCESAADAAWAFARLTPTPCMVKTRRGMHLYYRHPGEPVRNGQAIYGRFDIRGDGGYVVAPGALAGEHVYRWHRGGLNDLASCPVFDLDWLPTVEVSGEAHPDERAEPSVVDRAAKYLETCEPAINGQGGRKRTFRVAATLTRDFGLSVAQAFDVMQEYNERCDPPWTLEELLKEIQGAAERGNKAIGTKLGERT